ncbi:hypothetical protein AG1IA_01588 [Rhizoctonia solani AG-1 IA]|uniref:Uncharacterized protein n=1 Tax=Thanatephorus cucumeris (strain AG1-IA) TaxID=983506 RepID=L8X239_THACA|nr:hypothetical protein AG1IA_01588 [Rhizoctonia solani AG-1 IA]
MSRGKPNFRMYCQISGNSVISETTADERVQIIAVYTRVHTSIARSEEPRGVPHYLIIAPSGLVHALEIDTLLVTSMALRLASCQMGIPRTNSLFVPKWTYLLSPNGQCSVRAVYERRNRNKLPEGWGENKNRRPSPRPGIHSAVLKNRRL